MANGMTGAIDRRLRGLLPQEDIAAINSPGAAPGGGPGIGSSGTTIISPGQWGTRYPGAYQYDTGLGPVHSDPEAMAAIEAQQRGLFQGFNAVQRRLLAQQEAGLGQFIDPDTGQLAQFGVGAFSGGRPAFFSAGRNPWGLGMGLGGADELSTRAREIGEAVKRRLEELTGAPPNQPQFQSPTPMGPAITRRGRFGT